MNGRTAAEVEKDAARRRAGIKVQPQGSAAQRPARKLTERSAAQVDKDAHRRQLGQKVQPRGRLSDAAAGRGAYSAAAKARSGGALGGMAGTKGQKRDRIGRFA